jgi:D-alanyl-D-alanine carboxypeptidase
MRRALSAAIWVLVALAAAPAARAAPRPPVAAPSAIVAEASTGDVAYARGAAVSRPIASVTKLMTALLTLEGPRLSARVRAVNYRAAAVESQINLRAGERLTVADLLRGLLLASANDAAATLAHEVGGSRRAFVAAMNRRARALGLRSTRFRDPIGLDPGSRSSAADLVKLTAELRRFAFFRKTVDRATATLESGDRPRTIANRNTLVRAHPWVSGVKTGHTSRAGYALVASGTRRGVTLVSVVLAAPSEAAATPTRSRCCATASPGTSDPGPWPAVACTPGCPSATGAAPKWRSSPPERSRGSCDGARSCAASSSGCLARWRGPSRRASDSAGSTSCSIGGGSRPCPSWPRRTSRRPASPSAPRTT